jgi:hypothetical protein
MRRTPESGWRGEAAIQMAMSHYGVYVSQKAINRVGKPEHPDLYANTSLRSLEDRQRFLVELLFDLEPGAFAESWPVLETPDGICSRGMAEFRQTMRAKP